jgi:hypothetical protein
MGTEINGDSHHLFSTAQHVEPFVDRGLFLYENCTLFLFSFRSANSRKLSKVFEPCHRDKHKSPNATHWDSSVYCSVDRARTCDILVTFILLLPIGMDYIITIARLALGARRFPSKILRVLPLRPPG